jgi:hypothetical protein
MTHHAPRRPRLLLVMQTPDADAGRCGRKLRQRGYRIGLLLPAVGPAIAHRNGWLRRSGGVWWANERQR